jgi:hypothetical protein
MPLQVKPQHGLGLSKQCPRVGETNREVPEFAGAMLEVFKHLMAGIKVIS